MKLPQANPEHVTSMESNSVIFCTGLLNLVDPHIWQAKEVTTDTDKYGLVHYFCTGFP